MIQATVQTTQETIGIVGINQENLRRMKAGLPLQIQLEQMTPPGKQLDKLIVHYAETYVQVVDDMVLGGIPLPETMRQEARALDKELIHSRTRG